MALSKKVLGDGLWWTLTLGSHLLALATVLAVGRMLVVPNYVGGGSYDCYSALRDFAGPRPVEQPDAEFFDAGPPCWDEAKRRVITAAVLMPMMVASWVAGCVALRRHRRGWPFVAAFVVLAMIGLGA